jgi:hypothetical protein
MADAAIKLHAHRRDDGRLYITSSDLPGFRFLAEPEEEFQNELLAALREFYPIYHAAKAKADARRIALSGGALSHRHAPKEDFDLEAQFEMA